MSQTYDIPVDGPDLRIALGAGWSHDKALFIEALRRTGVYLPAATLAGLGVTRRPWGRGWLLVGRAEPNPAATGAWALAGEVRYNRCQTFVGEVFRCEVRETHFAVPRTAAAAAAHRRANMPAPPPPAALTPSVPTITDEFGRPARHIDFYESE